MVGDAPPHDSDDERDDLAALDFSVAENEPAESDLDALGEYAPRNPRRTTNFPCRCSP